MIFAIIPHSIQQLLKFNNFLLLFFSGRLLKWIKDNPQLMNAVQTRLGSPIIISCAMTHPAKKVTFYNKSESDGGKLSPLALTNGTKYQLLNLQELVIYDVQNSDDGVYVCRAENNLLQDKEIKIFINQCKYYYSDLSIV